MPSPKGDITILAQSLNDSVALKGFAPVLAGKNALALQGAPPRVVIFPVAAVNAVADDRTVTISTAWFLVTSHFWARDFDQAFDLRTRWFQAMRAQADAGGYYWKSPDGEGERWDTAPDTAEQGQEFQIDVVIRLDANLPTQSTGTVESEFFAGSVVLTADMGASDVTASVNATFELPASGVVHIGDEQMSYSGVTATTFTGLVRGINGTTAATHAASTNVYISPT